MLRGWTGVSDHIYSNKGNADEAYLILNLDISGFVGKVEFVDGQPLPVGTVSFVFETLCTEECTFMFMQVNFHHYNTVMSCSVLSFVNIAKLLKSPLHILNQCTKPVMCVLK